MKILNNKIISCAFLFFSMSAYAAPSRLYHHYEIKGDLESGDPTAITIVLPKAYAPGTSRDSLYYPISPSGVDFNKLCQFYGFEEFAGVWTAGDVFKDYSAGIVVDEKFNAIKGKHDNIFIKSFSCHLKALPKPSVSVSKDGAIEVQNQ